MAADKKGVALLMGRLGPPKAGGDENMDGAADEGSEYGAAASEVMDAFKAKDSEALGEALKSFFHLCQADQE